jgi:hypothetical protein
MTPQQRREWEDKEAAKAEVAKAVLKEMPTFEHAQAAYRAGRATALETFIVTHTPEPSKASYMRQVRFRQDLAAVLVEVAGLAVPKSLD